MVTAGGEARASLRVYDEMLAESCYWRFSQEDRFNGWRSREGGRYGRYRRLSGSDYAAFCKLREPFVIAYNLHGGVGQADDHPFKVRDLEFQQDVFIVEPIVLRNTVARDTETVHRSLNAMREAAADCELEALFLNARFHSEQTLAFAVRVPHAHRAGWSSKLRGIKGHGLLPKFN